MSVSGNSIRRLLQHAVTYLKVMIQLFRKPTKLNRHPLINWANFPWKQRILQRNKHLLIKCQHNLLLQGDGTTPFQIGMKPLNLNRPPCPLTITNCANFERCSLQSCRLLCNQIAQKTSVIIWVLPTKVFGQYGANFEESKVKIQFPGKNRSVTAGRRTWGFKIKTTSTSNQRHVALRWPRPKVFSKRGSCSPSFKMWLQTAPATKVV